MATSNSLSVTTSTGATLTIPVANAVYAHNDADTKAVLTYVNDAGNNQTVTLTIAMNTLRLQATNIWKNATILDDDGAVWIVNNKRAVKIFDNGDGTSYLYYNTDDSAENKKFYVDETAANTSTSLATTIEVTDDTTQQIYYINGFNVANVTVKTGETSTILDSAAVVGAGALMVAGTTVLTLTGGTNTTAATALVTHTKFVSVPTVTVGGTGYTTGDHVSITIGTGTQAVFAVTAVAGVVTAIASIVSAGDYTVNPTSGAGKVTTHSTGSGNNDLTVGITVSMIGALTVSVATAGAYTTPPSNPVGTTGGNNGCTLTADFETGTITGARIKFDGKQSAAFETLNVEETKEQITTRINALV